MTTNPLTVRPIRLTALERNLRDAVRPTVAEARAAWAAVNNGKNRPLLSAPDANTKVAKNTLATWSLSLQPAYRASCPRSTPGCRAVCLQFAGRNEMSAATAARVRRGDFLADDPGSFAVLLAWEVSRLPIGAGLRLNTLADVRYEFCMPELWAARPDIAYYDYTKFSPSERGVGIDLTFSASERWSDADIDAALRDGHRVSVVATSDSGWYGHAAAVDGDVSDERYNEAGGTLVVLRPKGRRVLSDATGFVRRTRSDVRTLAAARANA